MDFYPSKLGTQQYWEEFYKTELKNFEENSADTGECWFDDCGAEDRMVSYINEELNSHADALGKILDLGTGNGHLLFALRESGVQGDFLGIDYSLASIEFASKIAKSKNEFADIRFRHVDFLADPDWTDAQFDLILDKGTLDAIALSGVPSSPQMYVSNVISLLKPGGRFMITSCNFTKSELLSSICIPLDGEIEYPSFNFGGAQGSSVVTLIFQKQL